MFGAFRPSAPLSGGLLWKIPWRLSPPQKLRHRRRLRRVDNIVAILDSALKRDAAMKASTADTWPERTVPIEQRRSGKGPKRGDYVPDMQEASVLIDESPLVEQASRVLLADKARTEHTFKNLERWKAEMPTEEEMLPKDKYTIFNRYARGYRKGVHKLPKWTRVSQRLNPPGY